MQDVAASALLAVGVVISLLSAIGATVMRGPYNRLHFIGPISTVGAACIAAAVFVHEAFSQAGMKALLAAAIMAVLSAVLTHATARAAQLSEHGDRLPARVPGDAVATRHAGAPRRSSTPSAARRTPARQRSRRGR